MSVKRVVKGDSGARKAEEAEQLVAEFGLSTDDYLRWKPKDGGNFLYGCPTRINADGSITIVLKAGKGDKQIGFAKSVMPDKLERRTRGPRGGELWEAVS